MPSGSEEISGGNLYNRALVAALEDRASVTTMSAVEFSAASLGAGTYLVDTLDLKAAREVLGRRGPGQHFVLLSHHLPSLEPDLDSMHPSLRLEQEVLGSFDAYVATGEFMQRWLEEKGHGPVSLIEPRVQGTQQVSERPFEAPLRALMVCNLIPRKGVLAFLQALGSAIGTEPTELSVDIIGRSDLDAPYAKACFELVAASPTLSRCVRLLGSVAHEALAVHYQDANLFVSASRMETFGMSLQEARLQALPILAVRGGNSENHLIVGKTGLIFDNPDALAGGLVSLAADTTRHARYFSGAYGACPDASATWPDAASQLLKDLHTWFGAL